MTKWDYFFSALIMTKSLKTTKRSCKAICLIDENKYKDYDQKYTEKDLIIIRSMMKSQTQEVASKRKIYYLAKIIPKSVKRRIKKVITFLYNCYDH